MPSEGRSSWRRTLLVDLAALVVLLGIVEGVLQMVAPIYRRQLFDNEYTGSLPMEMNEDGYRGPKVPEGTHPGEIRVLGLGDSVTFGTGVATSRTWPEQVEKILREKTGRPVAGVNGGVEGASLEDIARSWDEQWSKLQPDAVVLALTGNMVSLEVVRSGETWLPRDRYAALHKPIASFRRATLEGNRLIHELCLPSFLSIETQRLLYWDGLLTHDIDPRAPYGAVLAHGWRQGDLDPSLAETAWDRTEEVIAGIATHVRAAGAQLVLTYMPPRFVLSDDEWDNEKNMPVERFSIDPLERAARIADRLHVTYVDARAAILAERGRIQRDEGRKAPMYIYFDYQHPNDDGHRAIAQAVAAAVGR